LIHVKIYKAVQLIYETWNIFLIVVGVKYMFVTGRSKIISGCQEKTLQIIWFFSRPFASCIFNSCHLSYIWEMSRSFHAD